MPRTRTVVGLLVAAAVALGTPATAGAQSSSTAVVGPTVRDPLADFVDPGATLRLSDENRVTRYSSISDWHGIPVVGIHGTNQPGLIPGTPSHGCIRVRNAKIKQLARLMPIGTPVEIV